MTRVPVPLVVLAVILMVFIVVVTLASYHAGLTWCPDCDGT